MPEGDALADVLKLMQDVGSRLTVVAKTAATKVADSPGGAVFEPVTQLTQQLAAVSTAWVTPVKALLDEQQEIMDAIAAWSEQQRILADRMGALAERHRALTSQTMAVLRPLLDQVEGLGGRRGDAADEEEE
jgi:hypothetical protein